METLVMVIASVLIVLVIIRNLTKDEQPFE